MKIYAVYSEAENEPRCYVEAKDIDDLINILTERLNNDEPYGMFPGWSPVEISKREMYRILNRFNEDDLYLVDEDEREAFGLWARMQSQTGDEKPVLTSTMRHPKVPSRSSNRTTYRYSYV